MIHEATPSFREEVLSRHLIHYSVIPSMTKQPVRIGCDVSKRTLDVAVVDQSFQTLTRCSVENTRRGYASLGKSLRPYRGSLVIVEATAGYHYGVSFALRAQGFDVSVINPLLMKKYHVSEIRKTKTDKQDAVLLGKAGWIEPNLEPFKDTPEYVFFKQIAKTIGKLKKQHQMFLQRHNQLEEFQVHIPKSRQITRCLERIIQSIDTETEQLEDSLIQNAGPAATLIASIPGVGLGTAATIVTELGDVSRFRNRDDVTAFAGLDPSVKESGTSIRGRSHLTKRGSRNLRRVLGGAAWGVMMHNPVFKAYYQKKKKEGKHYFTILVAMARKLLIIIYAMLKTNTPYDPSRYPQLVT